MALIIQMQKVISEKTKVIQNVILMRQDRAHLFETLLLEVGRSQKRINESMIELQNQTPVRDLPKNPTQDLRRGQDQRLNPKVFRDQGHSLTQDLDHGLQNRLGLVQLQFLNQDLIQNQTVDQGVVQDPGVGRDLIEDQVRGLDQGLVQNPGQFPLLPPCHIKDHT